MGLLIMDIKKTLSFTTHLSVCFVRFLDASKIGYFAAQRIATF